MLKRSAAIAIVCLWSAGAAAQQQAKGSWTPPKTAWGDPDLSGTWPSTDMVGVPFERPAELGTRTELTDEEFAEIERDLLTRIREIKERREGGPGRIYLRALTLRPFIASAIVRRFKGR